MRKLCFASAMLLAGAGAAFAAPPIDSAKITPRVFNDYPGSTLSQTNLYPANVTLSDNANGTPGGFANRHLMKLSDDGGASDAQFLNGDSFAFFADVTITGPAEGGLMVSPWWSDNDGQIMLNGISGEIAIFGGRLPFYSFTANGLSYVNGATYRMGVIYNANSNTMADPATIQYMVRAFGVSHYSPIIPLDEGNTAEDPPHGLWGLLNPFEVGGYYQAVLGQGPSSISWTNMQFVPEPASFALLALGALALRRR